ncbi:hypothetical protein [Nocardiopsis composta]|uniref:Uncharacterized protein n=1 Tax=Nocardiopsis composta TaxID=157465 RepID=A0A7W8QPC9_9ACTN|nr:hypothetical protein [Nocardiopsis composta]MBB5433413.1 hypothetical protein [Nocardiopsis composta]
MTSTRASRTPPPLESLKVRTILVSALPQELGTADAPERYTVPCVLSRQVEPAEITLIQGPDVEARLRTAGFAAPTLTISDRRLLVHDTNLHELAAGLAGCIASALRHVSETIALDRARRAQTLAELGDREASRIGRVRGLAEAVDFS